MKLQRKYERVLRRKDRQLEAAKKLSDENQSLRIANAELKVLLIQPSLPLPLTPMHIHARVCASITPRPLTPTPNP